MSLWLELLLRSAVLLGMAELMRRVWGSRPAAVRHKLLLYALLLLALLPLLVVLLPRIRVPLLSPAVPAADVSVSQTMRIASRPSSSPNWPLWIWIGGVLCGASPLLISAFATQRMIRHAKPMQIAPASTVPVLLSEHAMVPLTCGIIKPVIVLPASAREWTPLRLRAVVLHEMAHIERRDVLAQIAAQFVTALWWFQPLAWFVRRKLRMESELACDAAVLASGLLPSQYAAELLDIAQSIRRPALANFAGIGMARRGDLETRLNSILNPSRARPSRGRAWSAIALLTSVALVASSVTASTNNSHRSGGLFMKRSLLAALLASSGLSAATITGSVFDSRGAALADAKLILDNPDTGQKFEAVSAADGTFALPEAPGGEYILRIDKAGFKPFLSAFNLKDDSVLKRGLTLSVDYDQKNSPAAADSGNIRVGGQMAQENLIRKVQPIYPVDAKQAHLQGTVELNAEISKEGVPEELHVIRSPGASLSESALEAVRQWRYRPVLLNGNPVAITTDIIVNYTLKE
jgi:TonB family protein